MMPTGMSDEFTSFDQHAVIKVCGVGGGGNNAVNRMISEGLEGVEFIAFNTDAQALKHSPAQTRLQIGSGLTSGLGAGADPEIGRNAAEEDRERIAESLKGADMIFLTAGMGGGTGTGACPIIAEMAREQGALTVAIVTLPFEFEGVPRMNNAMAGLRALEPNVDTLIVVPNDRVAALSQHNVSFLDSFRQADEVLHNGVRAVTELITVPGLINLDFADVKQIMSLRGRALMGIGRASGENRASTAAEEAIVCPLLEQSNITGARGVVVNVRGGKDITMREVQDAVSAVKRAAHPDANIIFGAVVEEEEMQEVQVTVIAAGFPKEETVAEPEPVQIVEWAQRREQQQKEREAEQALAASAALERSPFEEAVQEVTPRAPEAPQEMDLFTASEEAQEEPQTEPAPPRDLNIPTFMRKRMGLG